MHEKLKILLEKMNICNLKFLVNEVNLKLRIKILKVYSIIENRQKP